MERAAGISKTHIHAKFILFLLFVIIAGIWADVYGAMPAQWHPLAEISADGTNSIATPSGRLNSSYLEGPINVSSNGNVVASGNLYVPSGRIGIGTLNNPNAKLEAKVSGGVEEGLRIRDDAAGAHLGLTRNMIQQRGSDFLLHAQEGSIQLQTANPATTRLYIENANGKIGIGTTNPASLLPYTKLTVASNDDTNSDVGVVLATNGGQPAFQLARSRGTLSSRQIVQAGDNLGEIVFGGYDGSDFMISSTAYAARIAAVVDGTPGLNRVPTSLIFETVPAGDTSYSERMRITSAGNVGIGVTNPGQKLVVAGTLNATSFTGDGSGLTGVTASNADKTDNNHVAIRSLWTCGGTNYMANTVWVKVYTYGECFNMRIENPSTNTRNIGYIYSKNNGAPTFGNLAPGEHINATGFGGFDSIDIRVWGYSLGPIESNYLTFNGLQISGYIKGMVIYDDGM